MKTENPIAAFLRARKIAEQAGAKSFSTEFEYANIFDGTPLGSKDESPKTIDTTYEDVTPKQLQS